MNPTTIFLPCRRQFRELQKYSARIVLLLAIVAFGSAWIGVLLIPDGDANRSQSAAQTMPSEISVLHIPDENTKRSFLDRITGSFYEAAQVLLLNMSSHGGKNFGFFIGLARCTAVLLVGLVAIQAIGKLFRDSSDYFRLWFAGRRSVFIGGLGRIGFQLAIDYSKQNKLVIVEEVAGPDHRTEVVEDAGAIVLEGDVTDINSLRDHIFRDPVTIHLVTGDDVANVNALVNVRRLREEFRKSKKSKRRRLGKCECYVHVDDPGLHGTLQRCLIESNYANDPDLTIHPFNIYHETACQLVIDKLTPDRPKKDQVAMYVIFGFDQMGVAMLKELVEFAHFENQKRARILVLLPPGHNTNAAEHAYQACIAQWSRLTPRFVHDDLTKVHFDADCDEWSCQKQRPEVAAASSANPGEVEYAANVHFCNLRNDSFVGLEEAIALARLAGASENNSNNKSRVKVKAVMLFCFEEDERNFRMANELNVRWQAIEGINTKLDEGIITSENQSQYRRHQVFQIPIFAFLPRSGPLRKILEGSADRFAIRPFGAVKEGIERAHDPLIEEVAMDIAWSYDAETKRGKARQKWCDDNNCEAKLTPVEKIRIPKDVDLGITPRDKYQAIWNAKPFWDQTSNRNAAEYARIMVQILGFSIAKSNERGSSTINFVVFEDDEKFLVAKIEHNRWMAERLMMGWVYGPKMNQPPQRITFCPNEVLKKIPEELRKDFNQIKAILEYLEKHGELFHRVSTNA